MIAGALLFLVLLFVLVYIVLKSRSIKTILLLFGISLVMIGFPGIQSIKFSENGAEIIRLANRYRNDPTDDAARDSLAARLAEIEDRPISNPHYWNHKEQKERLYRSVLYDIVNKYKE